MTLRSGTNKMRGSASCSTAGPGSMRTRYRTSATTSRTKGTSSTTREGMISGPIRRNNTFFMGGYQGFYENIPFPTTRTVPTEAQLRGDFSQTTTANGTPIIIYDPATTSCNANFSTCTRQPFANNMIPQERWHPISRALLQYIPRPNATPSNLAGSSNFVSSPNIGRYRYNSYLTRIDHVFNQNHRLSFSNSGNWGIEFRNENALPEPAIRSDNYPTHRNHYLVTADDNVHHQLDRRCGTPASPGTGSMSRTTRSTATSIRSCPSQGPYQLTGPPFPQINLDGYEGMFPRTFRQPKNDAFSVNSNISKTHGEAFPESRR